MILPSLRVSLKIGRAKESTLRDYLQQCFSFSPSAGHFGRIPSFKPGGKEAHGGRDQLIDDHERHGGDDAAQPPGPERFQNIHYTPGGPLGLPLITRVFMRFDSPIS